LSTAEIEQPSTLIRVADLRVSFETKNLTTYAVRGVSFDLNPGERLALVGESGSGKTATAMAILGLLPETAKVTGSIRLRDTELTELSDRGMSALRGKEIGAIFQDPVASLDPLMKIKKQVAESLIVHGLASRESGYQRAADLLAAVKVTDPLRRMNQYPHELSGGMNQRVTIGGAIACRPALLIADEPTTALDTTTQGAIMKLLDGLIEERGTALIIISHDIALVRSFADRVAVMYAGEIVEMGNVEAVFRNPSHPYTRGLLDSAPSITRRGPVTWIPGTLPPATELKRGCAFQPRCPVGKDEVICISSMPSLEPMGSVGAHVAACHFPDRAKAAPTGRRHREHVMNGDARGSDEVRPSKQQAVSVADLTKHFSHARDGGGLIRAVDGVSFSVDRGETFALVGESGSGKTTIARMLAGLAAPTGGSTTVAGRELLAGQGREARAMRQRIQMVFQVPGESLNPRMRIRDILLEPLKISASIGAEEQRSRSEHLIKRVGLDVSALDKHPHEFSGGQQQRIAIARALIAEPDLIVCDEPVTALDVSIRGQIMALLSEIQREIGVAYLFIAHDLAVVSQIAHRVGVLYLGKLVEVASAQTFFDGPRHPYSRALLDSVPTVESAFAAPVLVGEIPSAASPPSGCRFHTRCPKVQELCTRVEPLPQFTGEAMIACHFPEQVAAPKSRPALVDNAVGERVPEADL